jgi:hypothetical protein
MALDRRRRSAYDLGAMTSKVIADILTRHGRCAKDGDRYPIPSGAEATVFAAIGPGGLIIEKVTSVALEHEVVVVATSRGETYCLAHEDVRALRITDRRNAAGYA